MLSYSIIARGVIGMLFVILILNHDGYIGKGKKKLIFDYYSNANVNVLLRTRVLIEDISLSRERTVDHDVPFFASPALALPTRPLLLFIEWKNESLLIVIGFVGSLSFEFQSRPVELLPDFPWNGRIPGWNSRYSIYSAEKTEKRV